MKYLNQEGLSTLVNNVSNTFSKKQHTHTTSEITNYKVDSTLSNTSMNPVQNKAVKDKIDAIETQINNKTDTNTTYDLAASTSSANGNVKLNLTAGGSGSGTDSVSIKGTGATTVTTDSNGAVIIDSKNDKYGAAGTSLGLVKSGGDATIASGVIEVNDYSHKHSISNIDDLQATLESKAPVAHTHDDRYYTTTDIDAKLAGKANASHSHPVDASLNGGSVNPVQNKVVTAALNGKSNTNHTHAIDSSLSATSVNPVQNKVVKAAIDNLGATKVPASRTINGKPLSGDVTLSAADIGADAQGAASSSLSSAKSYTDTKIAGLINGAPSTLDTLGEIAKSMTDNHDVVKALESAVGTKANASDLTAHTGNASMHVTSTDKAHLNAAYSHANSSHAPSTAEPNQNAWSNIVVGGTTISADTKTDSLTLAGSNVTITPDAVNDKVTIGLTKSNVTSALGYTPPTTNTTYGVVSTTSPGLAPVRDGSASKYLRADGTWAVIPASGQDAIVTTSGNGAAYTASVNGIKSLAAGVCFTMIPHVASTTTSPTLNVNGLGAKSIRQRVSNSTTSTVAGAQSNWLASGKPIRVMYDGVFWVADFVRPDATTLYGAVPVANGGTGANTARIALQNIVDGADSATSTPTDSDWYLCSNAGGATSKEVNKRPMSCVWNYIKAKADKIYALATHTHTASQITNNGTNIANEIAQLKSALNSVSPAGIVLSYAGKTAPNGYLLCNGQAVSRSTYAALFAAIGTTYGSGDGSTTFNVPNLEERVVAGASAQNALNKKVGESSHTHVYGIDYTMHYGALNSYTELAEDIPFSLWHEGVADASYRSRITNRGNSRAYGNNGLLPAQSIGDTVWYSQSANTGFGSNFQPTVYLNYIISTGR